MTSVRPGETRVGWVGTGVMGSSMCGHVLARGFPVTVTTRTRAKAERLIQLCISLQAIGLAKKGTHSLLLALARLSSIDWKGR